MKPKACRSLAVMTREGRCCIFSYDSKPDLLGKVTFNDVYMDMIKSCLFFKYGKAVFPVLKAKVTCDVGY